MQSGQQQQGSMQIAGSAAGPSAGLFNRAFNAAQPRAPRNDTSKQSSLRARMAKSDAQPNGFPTPRQSADQSSLGGVELLPSSPSDSRRPSRSTGPSKSGAPPRRAKRNAAAKPYDNLKAKPEPSPGARNLLARLSNKGNRTTPDSGSVPNGQSSTPNAGSTLPGKPARLPPKTQNPKVIAAKFFSDETKKWLEGRYSGENLIDLSALPKDPYLVQHSMPPIKPRTGTLYFKVLNKFAQREGNTPITKVNLSGNDLDSLIAIKDLRWNLRQVHAVDLRDNPIKDVAALDNLMTHFETSGKEKIATHPVPITELRFDGCLFREEMMRVDEKTYFDEVIRRFPALEFLDGQPVSALRQHFYPGQSVDAATAPAPSIPVQPATTQVPQAAATSSLEDREALINAFSQQSGMNRAWAIMCLEPNGWDGERAWADFISKKDTIPPEAFASAAGA